MDYYSKIRQEIINNCFSSKPSARFILKKLKESNINPTLDNDVIARTSTVHGFTSSLDFKINRDYIVNNIDVLIKNNSFKESLIKTNFNVFSNELLEKLKDALNIKNLNDMETVLSFL